MNLFTKIYSFRMRIAMVLILTLVVTTAFVYRLNQAAERSIIKEVDHQRRDLAEAINIAQLSLSSSQWLREFLKDRRLLETSEFNNDSHSEHKTHRSHVQRILVVNSQDKVDDSSNKSDIDKKFEELGFGSLNQSTDLDQDSIQQKNTTLTGEYQLFKFPVETDKGKVKLVIIFSAENLTAQLQSSSRYRLLVTSGVLLVSILFSLILILEFTRPFGKLTMAAKQVTAGNFDVHLPVNRRD